MPMPQETVAALWIMAMIGVIIAMTFYAGVYGALAAFLGALAGIYFVHVRDDRRRRRRMRIRQQQQRRRDSAKRERT